VPGLILLVAALATTAERYEAPAECPGADRFIEDVRSKRTRAQDGDDLVPPTAIAKTDAGFEGTIAIERGGLREERRVADKSCAAVEHALALIAAIALDAAPKEAMAKSAAEPVIGPIAGPLSFDAVRATTPLPAPAFPRPLTLVAGAEARAAIGVLPGAAFAPSVFVELGEVEAWTIRLSAFRAASDLPSPPDGSARFALTALRTDLCPLSLVIGPVIGSPCATVTAGALDAAAPDAIGGRSATELYLAPGAAARVRWAIWGPIFADLEAGAEAPILRDHFHFTPASTAHDVSRIAATGALSAGVRIW
jgi:hypothetical protein